MFWRSLNLPLINYEEEFHLLPKKLCDLTETNDNITGVNFAITNSELCAPIVTLSTNGITVLEN